MKRDASPWAFAMDVPPCVPVLRHALHRVFSTRLTPFDARRSAPHALLSPSFPAHASYAPLPSYVPVMSHAQNRGLREELYRAFISRASQGATDNGPLIESILALKVID